MRVALLHPTYWPEVRRGSERLIHDLGVELAARGHEVTILTSHRGAPRVAAEDGVRVVRDWRPPQRLPLSWYEDHVAHALPAWWRLQRGGFDVAHSFYAADAWAALRARDRGGPPVVFSYHGIANRAYLVKRRYRLEMTAAAIAGADAVTALSPPAAAPLERYFGRQVEVLPGGVRIADFAAEPARAEAPTVVCAANLEDERKRGDLLLRAFAAARARRPTARLLLAGRRAPARGGLPAGVEHVDGDWTAALARLFGNAWISVLPAVDEAFGLVLLESLAAGTPVVATRSGAGPLIVDRTGIGELVEPDDPDALAAGLEHGLAAAPDAAVAAACRKRAAELDWAVVAPRYEELYERVLSRAEPARQRAARRAGP
jgi:phosphatidylinositol alpha-mannosyltransferase